MPYEGAHQTPPRKLLEIPARKRKEHIRGDVLRVLFQGKRGQCRFGRKADLERTQPAVGGPGSDYLVMLIRLLLEFRVLAR